MEAMSREDLNAMVGRPLVGPGDHKVGKVAHVYVDERPDRPDWLAVSTGLMGLKTSFVPVSGIRLRADDESKPPFYETPYDKDQVKGAPVADIDRAPTQEEMDLLARHYGTNHQS